jgi:threonylcarbamoyladenosine tRNA methylthiotransferase MtaB
LNQSEIDAVSTALQNLGHTIVNSREEAQLFIVNSCTVTVRSERKTRKLINRASRFPGLSENAKIIVAGCASGDFRREDDIFYVPNDYKHIIPQIVANWDTFEISDSIEPNRFNLSAPTKASTTRVNLKIQDGCDQYCSYCIIPYVRGTPQSKDLSQTIEEFQSLIGEGYREIVLTGVMIGNYQFKHHSLSCLVEQILLLPGEFRLHLSSISPHKVDEKLLELLQDIKMVKHLNLSLQSGSNALLERMNRKYTREEYLNLVKQIRRKVPDFNLTTDLIVGFPGESEKDFEDSVNLVKEAFFSHIHTFRYSPRPGTKAASLSDTVPESLKSKRSREIITLFKKQKREFYALFDGKKSVFLGENQKNNHTYGFNNYYVPMEIPGKLATNRFVPVLNRYENAKPEVLCGVPED